MQNEEILEKIKNAQSINPERHPLRYLSHKYWARKPYNVVRYHIEHFTEKGDTVLDPFGGSGVTAFEALAIGRKAYTIDLNPVATFIANQLVRTDFDLEVFQERAQRIISNVQKKTEWIYLSKCPSCNSSALTISAVYEKGTPKALFLLCEHCRKVVKKDPDIVDIENINKNKEMRIEMWYPTASLPQNSDVESVDQLFTRRNLYVLSELYDQISHENAEKIRELLLYTFTANLATASKLIPANRSRWKKGILPSGMWSIKRFWIPPTNVENNVLYYFQGRVERTRQAKLETRKILGRKELLEDYFSYTSSATDMNMIDDKSIDYIFTDPPFGRTVEYFNLSTMWAAWLKMKLDYSNELITNSSDTSLHEYGTKLLAAFSEMNRVLKSGRVVSLAFHNRDLRIWQVLMDSVTAADFRLVHIVHQPPAELSFTQMKMHKRAGLRGHFVYHFLKDSETVHREPIGATRVEEIIVPVINEEIVKRGGMVAHEIYSTIIPILVNRYRIKDINFLEDDIDSILKKHYSCEEEEELIWRRGRYIRIKEFVWRLTDCRHTKDSDQEKTKQLIRQYLREAYSSYVISLTLDEIYNRIFVQKWEDVAHPNEFDRLPCLPKSQVLEIIKSEVEKNRSSLPRFLSKPIRTD